MNDVLIKTILLIGLLWASACNPGKEQQEENIQLVDSEEMEVVVPVEIEKEEVFQPSGMPAGMLEELSSMWYMITNLDEEFVLYENCDAGNPTVHLFREDHQWELNVFYGQDSQTFLVKDHTYLPEQYKDEWEHYYKLELEDESGNSLTATLNRALEEGAVSSWSGLIGNGPVLFVNEEWKEDFRTVVQPCEECWGDECDEMEATNGEKD